ncbi:MOSC N-terminal beta barrel domain-containing protein [Entophlyctis helioformis]|nr:MOSC N-terminal beta barrel domain-containing protein [Entophlyctis helioformis]
MTGIGARRDLPCIHRASLRPLSMATHAVSSLLVFPVKGCAPLSLSAARLNEYGFEWDRFWMLASEIPRTNSGPETADAAIDPQAPTFTLCSQRQVPRMALLRPSLSRAGVPAAVPASSPSVAAPVTIDVRPYDTAAVLRLSDPASPDLPLVVPVRSKADLAASRPVFISVHGKPVAGVDEGDEAADWLSAALGTPVRLFAKHPSIVRGLGTKHTPSLAKFGPGIVPQTAFADGFPFLMLSEESIADVNEHLVSKNDPTRVSVLNFRPNIIIKASSAAHAVPFIEDTWMEMTIGDGDSALPFVIASRCTRCTVPSVNPETGIMGKEPTRMLQSYRRVDPGAKYESCVGVNVTHLVIDGTVRVGDTINVLRTGTHDHRGVWNNGTIPVPFAAAE